MSIAPPRVLFALLHAGGDAAPRGWLLEALEALLPALDWRGHVVVVGDPGRGGADVRAALVRSVARHVAHHRLAALHLHPTLYLDGAGGWLREAADWVEPLRPLEEEAYRERTDPRIGLHPVLVPSPDTALALVAEVVKYLDARAATPSLLVPEGREELACDAGLAGPVRILCGAAASGGGEEILALLAGGHVTDSAVERLEKDGARVLSPCQPHLVLDERRRAVFPCVEGHRRAAGSRDPGACLDGHPGLPPEAARDWCARCIAAALRRSGRDFAVNRREPEGHRVCLAAAHALASNGEHGAAAPLAALAAELAGTAGERAAALLLEGLAQFRAGSLAGAEEALRACQEISGDPGRVAYHRGEVQFAWRDWIEALERFAEALEHASAALPEGHIRFQMALCHINLEEYGDAMPHLDRAWAEGPSAPIAFYRGVCALHEESPARALTHFESALHLDPEREDLGRILLYRAICLKEMGRWEEAVQTLRQAAAADPDDLAIVNLLGFCLYTLKRHDEAVACFRRAVEIDPRSALDWANLGSNLRDLGRIGEAMAAYRRALDLDPSIGFARLNLERLRAAGGVEM